MAGTESDGAAGASAGGETPDDLLLDGVLDRFLRDLADGRHADGRAPDFAAVLPGRPDLRARVEETWRLALDVAPPRSHDPALAFPGYRIVRELGRGGMGQVLLAEDVRLGRRVALKVLPRRFAEGRARERFQREARAVARLEHPLIVPLYEMGETAGQPWFTLAYVEGATLAAALASVRGRDPASLSGGDVARAAGAPADSVPGRWRGEWWRAAAHAALDVAEALAHAHAQGVVHRDVKPSNVLLRRDGFALLFDFGLATVEDEATLTLTRGFLGTPHYASPEQAAGETESLDARSDVWSVGATLYEALTLQPPFPGPTTHEVLRRIQTWEPEPPSKLNPQVPRDLETVVLAAMEKDRARRTPSARALADDLRAVLDGRGVRAKRAGLIERGLRSVKRGRALTDLVVEQQARNAELRSAVLRAERNERLADERAEEARAARTRMEAALRRAEASMRFLAETLTSADPAIDGREVRVADVLERGLANTEQAFAGDPEGAANVQATILGVLSLLGRDEAVARLAVAPVDLASRRLGGDHASTLRLRHARCVSLAMTGRATEVAADAEDVARAAAAAFGEDDARAIEYAADAGQVLALAQPRGRAEETLRAAWARAARVLGADHELTLRAQQNLGLLLAARDGPTDEALGLLRTSYEGRLRAFGPRHPETLCGLTNLAQWTKESGRLDEALPMMERLAETVCATFGADHVQALGMRHNLAGALADAGRVEEAFALQDEVTAAVRASLPDTAELHGVARIQLARLHAALGRPAEAAALAREAGDSAGRSGSERRRADAALVEVEALRALGRETEADDALRAAAAWCVARGAEVPGRLAEALRDVSGRAGSG